MPASSTFLQRRNWLHRLGRVLALVTQLAVMLAPLAEGREERVLGPHVEAPRTIPHPGHRPESCAECRLLSVHGRTEERSQLPDLMRDAGSRQVSKTTPAFGIEREPSNSSRAPPL